MNHQRAVGVTWVAEMRSLVAICRQERKPNLLAASSQACTSCLVGRVNGAVGG